MSSRTIRLPLAFSLLELVEQPTTDADPAEWGATHIRLSSLMRREALECATADRVPKGLGDEEHDRGGSHLVGVGGGRAASKPASNRQSSSAK